MFGGVPFCGPAAPQTSLFDLSEIPKDGNLRRAPIRWRWAGLSLQREVVHDLSAQARRNGNLGSCRSSGDLAERLPGQQDERRTAFAIGGMISSSSEGLHFGRRRDGVTALHQQLEDGSGFHWVVYSTPIQPRIG